MKKLGLLPLLLIVVSGVVSGCSHTVTGVLGAHDPHVWVVRTNYRGVQEIYHCADNGEKAQCHHAPMVD